MKDEDDNDSCIIDNTKLLGLPNSSQSSSNNDMSKHYQISSHPNASAMILNENMPSPERPGTRPSPATAFLLKQISEANMPETGQFYERISHDSGSEKNRFLNLPAPYHLLPDTPYFRRAPIVPPPTRSLSTTEQIPIQQRIINRYLASMKMDDENGFAAIAQYERECYEHLYISSYPSVTIPEQQRYRYFGGERFREGAGKIGAEFDARSRLNINAGKHIISTDFFGSSMIDDETKICSTLGDSTNGDLSTRLPNQNYEI